MTSTAPPSSRPGTHDASPRSTVAPGGQVDLAGGRLVEDRCDQEEGPEEILEVDAPGERVVGMVEQERTEDRDAGRRRLAGARLEIGNEPHAEPREVADDGDRLLAE